MGLKWGCCLWNWGEIYRGVEKRCEKNPNNPKSSSPSSQVIFFIFLTVAKSIVGAMDLRSQGLPFWFKGRATEMDEWDPVTFCHPDFAFRQFHHFATTLTINGSSTRCVRAVNIWYPAKVLYTLCAGTVLLPVIKSKPCDQRYVFDSF